MADKRGRLKLQMPPVMKPKVEEPVVLSKDLELQGYLEDNFVFVDSSTGYSDKVSIKLWSYLSFELNINDDCFLGTNNSCSTTKWCFT